MTLADLDFYHVCAWYIGLRIVCFVVNVLLYLFLKGIGAEFSDIHFSF